MNTFEKILFSIGIFFFGMKSVFAVPPPDFIFNVGVQVAQFFSIAVLFLGAILATIRQAAKVYFFQLKNKKIIWIGLFISVIGIASTGAYYYGQYQQTVLYQTWLAESKIQNANIAVSDMSSDQLKIEETPETRKQEKLPLPKETPDIQFIRTYYSNLGSGNIDAAYEVSKKSVSLEMYKSWYKNVTSLNIDDLQKIDANKYSLKLALNEGEKSTNYAILITLAVDSQGNFSIQSSDVRTLTATEKKTLQSADNTTDPSTGNSFAAEGDFYEKNKDASLAMSNNDFQLVSSGNIFVLDAREDEEYDIGNFPNSTHIRFADLIAGEWIRVPTDQTVYVFCWSGIRGKEVADFLRSKKIVARYIEKGADGWVSSGGQWIGGIKFSSQYPEKRYSHLVTLDELQEKMAQGAVIVDSRIKDKYTTWHIPNSINIPIIYTPSSNIDDLLNEAPFSKPVITVCDDFVSCFDAKITGLKLEKKGHEFLGRYNKPWEYRNL
ncbi:hypothetical protein HYV56_00245 [Candidatus Peregrinibacteria bacterium]|nr:hypothetical protein [Candidatus Peregrinibacteria bacterium]